MSKTKPDALSANAQDEWALLHIALRDVAAKAMANFIAKQGIVARNSVFIEIPEQHRANVLQQRQAAIAKGKGKNSVGAEVAVFVVLNHDGTPNKTHDIFSECLAEAVEKHGNDYGLGLSAVGQVLGSKKQQGLVATVAESIPAVVVKKTPPAPPAAPDANATKKTPAPKATTKKKDAAAAEVTPAITEPAANDTESSEDETAEA